MIGLGAAAIDRRDNSPTIVETRDELSPLYRALRTVIRPLRPRLVAPPKKPLPRGSPQLSRVARIKQTSTCSITERQDEFGLGLWVYDFEPRSRAGGGTGASASAQTTTTRHHRVLYFAGGGFQAAPSSFHWRLVAQMARELANTHRFTLVSYPLAPANTAADSLPVLREYLRRLVAATAAADDYDDATIPGGGGGGSFGRQRGRISLMGDSSGGNIALSLGMWWAMQLGSTGTDTNIDTPPRPGVIRAVYAISPVVDMRDTNPDIDAADKLDPLLTKILTEDVAAAWSGTPSSRVTPSSQVIATTTTTAALARDDPSISPVCHDPAVFASLAAHGIRVHGIIGTSDCLAPDALLFQQKCVKERVPGRWLVWKGQMHCFVLAGVGGLMREGAQGIKFLEEVLREEEERR